MMDHHLQLELLTMVTSQPEQSRMLSVVMLPKQVITCLEDLVGIVMVYQFNTKSINNFRLKTRSKSTRWESISTMVTAEAL